MAKLVKVPQIGPARQARRFRSGPNVFCKQGIQFSCVAGGFDAWNFQVNRCSRGGCPEPSPYPSEGRRFDMERAQQDLRGDRRLRDGAVACRLRSRDG
jgi:hypothetical protein